MLHGRVFLFGMNYTILVPAIIIKISWALEDTQKFIDIIETVYRGTHGLVISRKDYTSKYCY